jgi:hypothetical protein
MALANVKQRDSLEVSLKALSSLDFPNGLGVI